MSIICNMCDSAQLIISKQVMKIEQQCNSQGIMDFCCEPNYR